METFYTVKDFIEYLTTKIGVACATTPAKDMVQLCNTYRHNYMIQDTSGYSFVIENAAASVTADKDGKVLFAFVGDMPDGAKDQEYIIDARSVDRIGIIKGNDVANAVLRMKQAVDAMQSAIKASTGDDMRGWRNGVRYAKSLLDSKEPEYEREGPSDNDVIDCLAGLYCYPTVSDYGNYGKMREKYERAIADLKAQLRQERERNTEPHPCNTKDSSSHNGCIAIYVPR